MELDEGGGGVVEAGGTSSAGDPTTLKLVLLMILFMLTFAAALVPLSLRRAVRNSAPGRRQQLLKLFFGLLSVYGGGVFLATCLLDLLVDATERLGIAMINMKTGAATFPLAEFLVAIGFFLVLSTEQLALFFREVGGGDSGHGHADHPTIVRTISRDPNLPRVEEHAHHSMSEDEPPDADAVISRRDRELLVEGLDCDIHFNPDEHSTLRALILVLALSLHATFEGLALGLIPDKSVILQIFAALCIHKSILGFSLGLRLVQSKLKPLGIGLCAFGFAVMAPVGGAAGLAVMDEVSRRNSDLVSGSLQAVACGTFLYVTAFEILPHELNQPGHRISKLLTLFAGFTTITLFVFFFPI